MEETISPLSFPTLFYRASERPLNFRCLLFKFESIERQCVYLKGNRHYWHHSKDNGYDRPVHLGSTHKKANMLGLNVVYIVEVDCYPFTE